MRFLHGTVLILALCGAASGEDLPAERSTAKATRAAPVNQSATVAIKKTSTPALSWEHAGRLRGFAFTPNHKLAAASGDAILFWDLHSGMQPEATRLNFVAPVTAFAFAPSGEMLAVGGEDGVVRFWNLANGAADGEMKASEKALRSLIYTPDGSKIVTGDDSGRIAIWSVATRQQEAMKQGHVWPVIALAVSPDSGHLVSGAQGRRNNGRLLESEVLFWDLKSLKKMHAIEDPPSMWLSVLFWPDRETIALSGAFKKAGSIQTELRLVKAAEASPVKTLVHPDVAPGQGVGMGAAALADGRLVTCGPGGALLWSDVGELQYVFDDRRTSWTTLAVCASQDQGWIATFTNALAKGADRDKDESYTTYVRVWKLPK